MEINLECLKIEYEEFKKDSKIEKSSFLNLLEQNQNLIKVMHPAMMMLLSL